MRRPPGSPTADAASESSGGEDEHDPLSDLSRYVKLTQSEEHDTLMNLLTGESKTLPGAPGCCVCVCVVILGWGAILALLGRMTMRASVCFSLAGFPTNELATCANSCALVASCA